MCRSVNQIREMEGNSILVSEANGSNAIGSERSREPLPVLAGEQDGVLASERRSEGAVPHATVESMLR